MNEILALYGFRSKQEFIYRTNRMREITGASELLATFFEEFLEGDALKIDSKWRGTPWNGLSDGFDGVVAYEGGGNLCILYRDHETYVRANRTLSRRVLERAHGLGLIAAYVPVTDSFADDLTKLHREHDKQKNCGPNAAFCNVLPITKVDRTSFQPIISPEGWNEDRTYESVAKRKAFNARLSETGWEFEGKFIDDLGEEKGVDSLVAVIYCDGNSIGDALKKQTSRSRRTYEESIESMRSFSVEVHDALVEKPLANIRRVLREKYGEAALRNLTLEERTLERFERRSHFRTVIDHGDEITLIVNAHAALDVVDAYFEAVEASGKYHACAGIAVCHSHDPFSEVYKIAEACCESAKEKNRRAICANGSEANASYVDFHFCRSGVTGTLEQIRGAQERSHTLRPYAYRSESEADLAAFEETGRNLCKSNIARGDIKNLASLILTCPEDESSSRYRLEMERLRFKQGKGIDALGEAEDAAQEDARKLLFDVSGFFDVWFGPAPKDVSRSEASHE